MKIILSAVCALIAGTVIGQSVSRNISDPDVNKWQEGTWTSASGSWTGIDERAPNAKQSGKTLRVTAVYPGGTFAGWGMFPQEKTMPGKVASITAWTRAVQRSTTVEIIVKDANGAEKKFGLPIHTPEWSFVEIRIPDDMVSPLTFEYLNLHNWEDRGNPEPTTVIFDICDLRVNTDISAVPLAQRPYSLLL